VQGALASAPKAAGQLFNGDPEQAAETLLWGTGTGMIFGGLEGLGVAAAGRVAPLVEHDLASELTPEILGEAAGKAVGMAKKAAAGYVAGSIFPGLGHAAGAALGAVTGETNEAAKQFVKGVTQKWLASEGASVARSYLKELAADPFGSPLGQAMAQQGSSVYGQALAKVPGIVAAMGGAGAEAVLSAKAQRAIKDAEPKSHDEALEIFKRDSERITKLAADPVATSELTSQVAHALATDPVAQQVATVLQLKAFQAIGVLNDALPKPPAPPAPFTGDQQPWQPTAQQLQQYFATKAVLNQPLVVFHKLQDGTLTKAHTDAMQKFYPTLFKQLQKAVIQTSAKPNAPVLPYPARVKLSSVLGVPLDPSVAPQRIAQYQSSFNTDAEPSKDDNGPGQMPGRGTKVDIDKLPDSSTVAQRVSQKGSQPKRVA
jgi:hypothetical protein